MIGYFRRTPLGWTLIAVLFGFAAFYAFVVWSVATTPFSEAYRRTYMTREFAVYPQSVEFRPRDGLEYRPGKVVEVAEVKSRWYLARFDWWRFNPPTPFLKGLRGRVFLSVPAEARASGRPHRLRLEFTCRMPPGRETRLDIAVNGTTLGDVACGTGPSVFETTLPAGLFPRDAYEDITITRRVPDLWERVATRLALRFDAVALDRFVISPVE